MTVDELATLVRKIAKEMKLPVVKIVAIDAPRPLDFRAIKRPPTGLRRAEPHVTCEIQKDGAMALGKMAIALSECTAGDLACGYVDRYDCLIKERLTQAARDAGIEVKEPACADVPSPSV